MDAKGFYVKDNKMEKVLLTSNSFDGLYNIQTSPSIARQIACYESIQHKTYGMPDLDTHLIQFLLRC